MSKEISPQLRAVGDAFKPTLKPDATTGVTGHDEAAIKDVFTQFLPENINLDVVESVQDFTLLMAAGLTLAHGEVQEEHLKAHPELKSGSLKVKLGHSQIETVYERERSGTAMGKEWRKFGVATTDVVLGVGRKKTDHKTVVAYLGERGASVFSN